MDRKEIWVYAEILNDHPAPVFYELLSKAGQLSDELNYTVAAVVIGSGTKAVTESLKNVCDKIYVADNTRLEHYTNELYSVAFEKLIREYGPEIVLIGATDKGSDLAPAVAAKMKTGLAAHCIQGEI